MCMQRFASTPIHTTLMSERALLAVGKLYDSTAFLVFDIWNLRHNIVERRQHIYFNKAS
jgi:hypothetical protein